MKQHSGYIGREKSVYYGIQLISVQPRLGTRPGGLGEAQAVTTHRPNSNSWVGRWGLKWKVMVGGRRQSIRASGGAGPGRDERRRRWMVVELPRCKGTKAGTNVGNRVCRATVEHRLRQFAAAGGEESESERRIAEGRKLEPLMGDRVDRATEQHGIAGWTDYRES